jgi:hypothetical protein
MELDDVALNLLASAVESRIITDTEFKLINESRGVSKSLRTLANESGDSYTMLRKRRSRAELKLRHHMLATGVVQ